MLTEYFDRRRTGLWTFLCVSIPIIFSPKIIDYAKYLDERKLCIRVAFPESYATT